MSFTRDYERPLYWQDFEDLSVGVFRVVFGDQNAQKNGRTGQPQAGVDVFGIDCEGRYVGIQCKRLDERGPGGEMLAGGILTLPTVKEETANAESFSPTIFQFIMATTAKTDAKIQGQVRAIDKARRAKNKFGVVLWFWEYYNGWLNNENDLQRWYYSDVIHTRHPEITDRFILETFHMTFSRNAFRDPIGREEPQPFLKAIEDTQRALSTGELRDRETKTVIRKAPGGIAAISSPDWQAKLNVVGKAVADVRSLYKAARASNPPGLIEYQHHVQILDATVGDRLDKLRAEAILQLNVVLAEAGLSLVSSPLV